MNPLPTTGAQGEPGRVLIVDDDPGTRRSLEALLSFEFAVSSAASVAAAAALLPHMGHEVILTDYEMPGGSGVELVELAHERFPGVQVILLTGHAQLPELQRLEATRKIVRVLSKPYEPRRLISWLHSSVKLARMSQATLKLAQQTSAMRGQR